MKSAREYLRDNDFLGCFDRWKNATWRWKEHWFDTCGLDIYSISIAAVTYEEGKKPEVETILFTAKCY